MMMLGLFCLFSWVVKCGSYIYMMFFVRLLDICIANVAICININVVNANLGLNCFVEDFEIILPLTCH